MSYKEIEIEVLVKKDVKAKYSFNVDNISHYKQYIAGEYDKKDTVVTMVYLKGNPTALRLNCGYDTFKKKLGSNSVDLSSLSSDQKNEVLGLLEKFGVENTK
jgi:hypothetical protein